MSSSFAYYFNALTHLTHLIGYQRIEKGSTLNLRIGDLNFISVFDQIKSQTQLNPVIPFT